MTVANKQCIEPDAGESLLRKLVQAIPDMAWIKDEQGNYVDCNPALVKFLGASETEIIGRAVDNYLSEKQSSICREHDRIAMAAGKAQINEEWVSANESGNSALLETIKIPLVASAGGEARLLGIARDITRYKYVEEELRQGRQLLDSIASHISGIIFCYRNNPDGYGSFSYISRSVIEIYGLLPEALREDSAPLFSFIHPDDQNGFIQSFREAGNHLQPWSHEYRTVRPEQGIFWRQVEACPEMQEDGSVLWYGIITDISERKKSEEMIWRQANFDMLTGLPNRRMFRDHLEQALRKANRDSTSLALIVIDLDHFQEVNDALGHDMGDQLLTKAAQRLRQCVRDSDIVARLGGDEFILVLNDLSEPGSVERAIHEMLYQLAEPFRLGEVDSHVSASIGVTLFPYDAVVADDLLKNANQAMYVAKKKGRNRHNYFTQSMQDAAQNRMTLLNDLRAAMSDYPFILHYQPIVDLANNQIYKAEALIRWQHPTRGMVGPVDFIPIAEETGLIDAIGDWVFYEATEQAEKWRASLHPEFQISINMSPVQFRSDNRIPGYWSDHLEGLNLSGRGVAIEITEGLLLEANHGIASQIQRLHDAGIQVALDDFGTGYSSLSYLKKFDIDYIKIDQSFIQNMVPDSSDLALCEAIIVMAHKLGMKVIAEGVETKEQRELLKVAGCDYAQGYLFSRPVPSEKFETLFLAGRL